MKNWQRKHLLELQDQPVTFEIRTRNSFYDGWLKYVLGASRPESELEIAGFTAAQDSFSCDKTREVLDSETHRGFNIEVQFKDRRHK